jgi:hypothetical protein
MVQILRLTCIRHFLAISANGVSGFTFVIGSRQGVRAIVALRIRDHGSELVEGRKSGANVSRRRSLSPRSVALRVIKPSRSKS